MARSVSRVARKTGGEIVGIGTRLEGMVNNGTGWCVVFDVIVVGRLHDFPSIYLHNLGVGSRLL